MGPTPAYVTTEEINRRVRAILGLADPDAKLYDGTDLPSADAAREIDDAVQTYRAMGDTAEFPVISPMPLDTPKAVQPACVGE